ncbi:toll-like receptor 6 [Mytilus galloprovincialis]|uniref:Toll-like receptor 6 n=1 Tax=Mytilus galloprovincialis TaxID=29158 RepID=A0A8B6FRK1_MYTGA|nr:toll-like receptor 6 [Mytilus galloprovincialis]
MEWSIVYSVFCVIIFCNEFVHALDCDIRYEKERRVKIADCKNRGLTVIPQYLPGDINVLDMSLNRLEIIGNNSFVNYRDLQELYLSQNQLSYLSDQSFQGLHKITILDMSRNILNLSKVYSAKLFHPIKNLTKLDIRRNMPQPIDFVTDYNYPDHSFGILTELSFLGIDMMPLPHFGSGFGQMTTLKELHFDSCYLVRLSNETFQRFSSSVEQLTLRNCRLHFVATENNALLPFPNLHVIDFSGTFMHLKYALQLLQPYRNKTITTLNFGRVSDLSIDSKDLPYVLLITADIVKYLKTICVENLDLSENGIVDYEPGSLLSFDHPECLRHISFKGNRFFLLTEKNLNDLNIFFNGAIRLKSLDYSYNTVNYAIKNYVTAYSGVVLPKSLEKIDISYTIANSGPKIFLLVPKNNSFTYLDASYTKVTTFISFMDFRLETFFITGGGYEDSYNLMKQFPNNTLKTIVWKNGNIGGGIRLHGNRLFIYLSSIDSMDISENDIWYFPDGIFKPMPNLTYLSLRLNLLQSIPPQLLDQTKIKMLDVSKNLLTSVSSTIRVWADKMQYLHGMTLILTDNAFECTCDNIDFIRWIQTTKVNLDSRSYKCKLSNGTVIDTLIAYNSLYELFAHCKNKMWLTFASTLLSTCVTFLLLLIAYSKRWKIIFSIYGVIRRVVERKVRKYYQYDVYISYEGDIVIWIKDVLIPKLETEWGLTMCIKDRDFLVGTSLADTEVESIQNSRSIIFLITPEFLSSRDCLFELDRAKYEKRNLERIIVITKDITITNIPIEFSYIWNYAYLVQWPQDQDDLNDIWRKLRLLLTDGFVVKN